MENMQAKCVTVNATKGLLFVCVCARARVFVCLILCGAPSALQRLCATLLQSPAAPVDRNKINRNTKQIIRFKPTERKHCVHEWHC